MKLTPLELYKLLVLIGEQMDVAIDEDTNKFIALGKIEYKLLAMVEEL